MKRDTIIEVSVAAAALAAGVALFAWAGEAHGVEVYRCGNTYQDAPCAGGQRLDIDPNTNLIQRETRVPTGAYDTPAPVGGGAHLPNPLVKPAPEPVAEHFRPRRHFNPWIPVVPATRHLLPGYRPPGHGHGHPRPEPERPHRPPTVIPR